MDVRIIPYKQIEGFLSLPVVILCVFGRLLKHKQQNFKE